MAFIIHLFVATLCLIHLSVGEPECRTLNSVKHSEEDLETNVQVGGHIWQHIGGLTKKPKGAKDKDTQAGKSMFKSEQAFQAAWAKMEKLKTGTFATCPSTGGGSEGKYRRDTVPAKDIGVNEVYLCTAIDKITKLCTTHKTESMEGRDVVFDYMWKSNAWIIRTAWPKLFNVEDEDYVPEKFMDNKSEL